MEFGARIHVLRLYHAAAFDDAALNRAIGGSALDVVQGAEI
jgi:hypothetical protein